MNICSTKAFSKQAHLGNAYMKKTYSKPQKIILPLAYKKGYLPT